MIEPMNATVAADSSFLIPGGSSPPEKRAILGWRKRFGRSKCALIQERSGLDFGFRGWWCWRFFFFFMDTRWTYAFDGPVPGPSMTERRQAFRFHRLRHFLHGAMLSCLMAAPAARAGIETCTTVVSWGDNALGQTNAPTELTNAVDIAACSGRWDLPQDSYNLALTTEGKVIGWGWNDHGQTNIPPGLNNVVAMAAGWYHAMALRADGSVVSWGTSENGQTNVPAGLTNAIAIAAGEQHSLVLKADGTVEAWGWNDHGQTNVPSDLTNVVAIAASSSHNYALKLDGTVTAWGWNDYGQAAIPVGLSNVVKIAAGHFHGMALKSDGTVVTWGAGTNDTGQAPFLGQRIVPADLSNVVSIAAGEAHSLALKADGTVVAWGRNDSGQSSVPAWLSNVIAIAGSRSHSLALRGPSAPFVYCAPNGPTAYVGTMAFLRVVAIGRDPLFYQWFKDGVELAARTNAFLVLPDVSILDAGMYSVLISNSVGNTTTQSMQLSVSLPPPIITQQPTNQVVLLGSDASFVVSAEGAGELQYQWLKDGIPLDGQTNATLQLLSVQSTDAGRYSVAITSTVGTVTSQGATLTVVTRPEITIQPLSQSIVVSQTVTFTVVLTGTQPLNYQWYFNGSPLPGRNTAELVLENVQLSQAGGYSVTVTNAYGSITSDLAVLTLLEPPSFISGNAPPGMVSWWPAEGDAQDIVGAADGTLQGAGFASGMVGQGFHFDGIDDAVLGDPISSMKDTFTIEFWASPTASRATTQESATGYSGTSNQRYAVYPQNGWGAYGIGGACAGISVGINGISVFEHSAEYLPSLLVHDTTIAGWTHVAVVYSNKQPSLYVAGMFVKTGLQSYQPAVFPSGAFGGDSVYGFYGYYQGSLDEVSLYDRALTDQEIAAICAAGSAGKRFPGEPLSRTVNVGEHVTFRVGAQGTLPLSYQWLKNGVPLDHETDASLTLQLVQVGDAGMYSVIVTNIVGAITSRVATLTVLLPPTITKEPVSQTVVAGQSATLAVEVEGTAPFNYRWQKGGAEMAGRTEAVLTFDNVQASDAGDYRVLVSNAAGFATSQVATLTVLVPPGITQQPQDQTVVVLQNTVFSASASGTPPLAYQWYKEGMALEGQVATDLNLTAVQFTDAGAYTVVVTNVVGAITSTVATLTVVTRPAITEQPLSQSVVLGHPATFTVETEGTEPLTYQWFFNGSALPGRNSAELVLENVQPSQAGGYSVTVANAYGSVNSEVALLTVLEPPAFTRGNQPADMISWWPGEGTASDVLGSHHGTPTGGIRFVGGMVGRCFSFDGVDDAVTAVPFNTLADTFTIEFWVLPTGERASTPESVNDISGTSGQRYALYPQHGQHYSLDGACAGVSVGINGVSVFEHTSGYLPSLLVYDRALTNWTHIAVVYQNKQPELYINGMAVRTGLTSQQVHVYASGAFGGDTEHGGYGYYAGLLDEVSIYDRALVADEIQSIVAAGSNGKLSSGEPCSRTVRVGDGTILATQASGTMPLIYQWFKNGFTLEGETNRMLEFLSVQADDAGGYVVNVSNVAGSITSQVATLTVEAWLSVQTNGAGTISWDPDGTVFPAGSCITLTCTADPEHEFTHWSGDAEGSDNPLTLTLERDKSVIGHFVPTYTVVASASGRGTAAVSPQSTRYRVGTVVQLEAIPDRWHAFTGWNDGSTGNPREVVVESNSVFVASFAPTEALETVQYGGVRRLAPVGMPALFVDGLFVTNAFVEVRGSAEVSMQSTFPNATILYSEGGMDPSVSGILYAEPFQVDRTATFRAVAYPADFSRAVQSDPLEIIVLPVVTTVSDGGGSTSVEPPAGPYYSNTLAVINAQAAPGWTFLQWLGDVNGTNPTVDVTVSRDKKAKAIFGTTLATTVVGSGTVLREPDCSLIPYGHQARVVAVPQPGNYFAFWGNAGSGTANPLMFVVTNPNPVVTAVFAALGGLPEFALAAIPVGRGQVLVDPPGNRHAWGTNIVLTAIPEPGQQFLGWTGNAAGMANPLTVVMDDNKVITATFTRRPVLELGGILGAMTRDGYRLSLRGEFGGRYVLEYSPDFGAWSALAEVTNAFGVVQFTDGACTNGVRRFYRALEPPGE